MNEDEYKSILKFFTSEENRLGNVFTGQSNTSAKSVAKGVLQGIFMGRFTTIRSYEPPALNKISSYYAAKLNDDQVRVISSQKMIQFLNRFADFINEREKSAWKRGGINQLGYVRIYQRAQQYTEAIMLNERTTQILEKSKQKSLEELSKTSAKNQSSATKQLLELKKLLDEGILTQEEYDKKAAPLKKIILS